MLVVLCRDPLDPSLPDRAFGAEAAALDRLGIPFVTVDYDALEREAIPARAVRSTIPNDTGTPTTFPRTIPSSKA